MTIKGIYLSLFGVTALACLLAVVRARTIGDRDTRVGLIGLLVLSAAWAGAQGARLLMTAPPVATALYLGGLVAGLATVGAWLYFCSAYSGHDYHRNPGLRWTALAAFLGIAAIKVTNPLHGLYFTTRMTDVPFRHLVVDQLGLHWAVTVLAYALTAVGFYLLFRLFVASRIPTTGLGVLVSLAGGPVLLDVLGFLAVPWILKLNYEPIGVAAFAVGALYITEDTFEQVRWIGNQQVLDSLNEAVIVLDDDDRVQDYNRRTAELFPELVDGIGASIADVLPAIGAAVESGAAGDGSEEVVAHDDGEETRYYLLSVTRLTVGPHSVGSAVVCADVTETERQRRRLRSQSEQLDGFAAAITHELRNTLVIAEGNVDLVADAVENGERAVAMEAVERVDEATDRMTTVVGELATLAKLGQPAEELTPVPFAETATRLWDAVGPADVTLRVDGDDTIEADPERLEELLRNVGELAAATGATTLAAALADGQVTLTTDGDAIGPGTEAAFFQYGMAVPTATTGMLGPNIQTLARAQDWTVTVDEEYRDGIRLLLGGVDMAGA